VRGISARQQTTQGGKDDADSEVEIPATNRNTLGDAKGTRSSQSPRRDGRDEQMTYSCKKCGHLFQHNGKLGGNSPLAQCSFRLTGFRCEKCGKYNDIRKQKAKGDAKP
jgi:predicted RNA-binding Zn-ribbon protein involved in translation (DUF1610 family)